MCDDCLVALWIVEKMAELKQNKQRNGKLSLYPLKFEEAVKDILRVRPPEKRLLIGRHEQRQEKVNED
jgi:hypothetical protein